MNLKIDCSVTEGLIFSSKLLKKYCFFTGFYWNNKFIWTNYLTALKEQFYWTKRTK